MNPVTLQIAEGEISYGLRRRILRQFAVGAIQWCRMPCQMFPSHPLESHPACRR